MAGRTFGRRTTTADRGRAHARWLVAAGAVLLGGLVAVAAEAATKPAYAAKASVAPRLYYIGDSAGSVYTVTVKNTGTTTGIGAVEINRPATWTITSCPTPPAGWTATATATKCRFRSATTKSDDIKPGTSKTFNVKAKTDPGTANRTGTWAVVVSSTNHFATTSALKSASPTGAGLSTTLYTFELTTAVVRDVAPLPGTACPAADKDAILGSNVTVVVCGKNRASVALTPSKSYSTLGGTFVQAPGTFVSKSIARNSGNVVLANWTATTVSGTYGTGKKVIAGIGASSNRRSPLRTFTGYSALSQPPTGVADAYATAEDTALVVAASGVLANDTDAENDTLTARNVTAPANGTVTLAPEGGFTYTPNADFHGTDSFTYTAYDTHTDSAATTVTITVNPVNDAPVAADDTATTDEDAPATVSVRGNDSDVDTDPLAVSAVDTTGVLGTVTNNGTDVTYDPDGAFEHLAAGETATETFTYTVSDGTATDTATVTVTVTGVNDAPVAAADTATTGEDATAVVSPLANDTDAEPGALTLTAVDTAGTAGSVTGNADGTVTYDPGAAFQHLATGESDTDTFAYTVTDAGGATDTATVTVTVTGANDAVAAADDAADVSEDSAGHLVTVLGNDTDAESQPLTVSAVDTTGTTGTVTNDGTHVTYDPNGMYEHLSPGETATDTFSYTVSDGHGGTDTATVTITVTGVNDAPVAVADSGSTTEDAATTVGAAGNDSDVDGTFSITSVDTTGLSGTVTDNADGTLTYDPAGAYEHLAGGASASAQFSYTVTDDDGGTDTATVTVTVNGVNDAPVAADDTPTVGEDSTGATVAVLANDSDAESQTLSVSAVDTTGTTGTVTDNGTDVTYDPNGMFDYLDTGETATDTFTYTVTDAQGATDTATVTVTVAGANDAPVAAGDGPFQTYTDTLVTVPAPGVLANDSDVDGETLTAGNASDPANGTVTLNPDGSFGYTPDTGYNGTDTFTYDVSDGTATHTATVTISVVPPNATPTADATSASGDEDGGAITVTLTGHDSDGDALTFTAGTATKGLVTVPGGTSCDSATPSTCTATVTYTPNADSNGTDTFTYTVNDGTVDSAAATATITVNAVNDAPGFTKGADQTVAEDAGAQTVAGWATAISAGPANESAQTVSFTVTTSNDALFAVLPAVDAGGALSYTPALHANGSATVTVVATDDGGTAHGGDATGAAQTFSVTVSAVNDAPSFTKGADQTVLEDAGAQSVSGWATAISKGPADESAQTLSFTSSNDNNALFSVQPGVTPTGTLVYTPAANAVGSATVSVSLSDTGGTANGGDDTSDTQTFTITVTAVNDAPSFTDAGDQTVLEDAGAQTVNGFVTGTSAGPADESAQAVTVTVSGTSNDALFAALPAIDGAGTLTYTPAADQYGSATVTAAASDDGGVANGGDDTGADETFTITVTPVNDVPVADDDAHEVTEDTAEDIPVLTGDTDADPTDTLTPTVPTNTDADTNDGALTVNADGTVAFDPAGEFDHLQVGETETDTFTYTVSDGNGGTDTATVTVTVTGVNDSPSATPKTHTAIGNTLLAVNEPAPAAPHTSTTSNHLLVGVTDPDDTVFTASSGTASANGGTVTTDSDGSFLFLPPQGHTGNDTFTFTVTDAHGGTDTGTATVTVSGMVWYVDATAATAGSGRSSEPFPTLAPINTGGAADAKDGSGDHIFVYEGAYTGGLALEAGQKLWGEPQGLSVASTPLVAAGGANPTISNASGHGITLASGADVQRVNVGASSGFGISGASVTNATVGSNTTVNDGVSLTGSAAGTITVASTISNSANQAVVVSNRTGGSVTLSGPVTSTGAGVALTGNTGAVVALTGQLALTTTTNDGFVATGGGTVIAPHTANAVTTTAGRGVVVQNTTIGANDLVFRSVNVNTAGSATPANGIVLENTGTAGNLTVTGTGTAASGGTIRATTGAGVSLTGTRDVALTQVKVQDAGGDGVHGSGVTNLSLTGVQVLGAGDADEERAVDLTNAGGTVTINGGTYDDAADDLVKVKNASTNVTVNVSNGATFSNQTQALAGNAFDFAPDGTSAITANITGSTFSNLKSTSVNFGATTLSSSGSSTLSFTNNTVTGGAGAAAGVTVSGQENTTTNVAVTGNGFSGAGGNGVVNHDVNDNANVFSTVANNTFTSPVGHAIVGAVDEDGDVRMRIDSNSISNAGGDGIELTNFGDDSLNAMTSTASFIVTNNTVNGHSLNAATQFVGGIGVFHFEDDADTTCTKVTGNTVTGTPAGFYDIFLQDNGVSKLRFEESPDTASTGTVATSYIQGLNPGTTLANIDNVGAVYSNGVTCAAP